jgi:hypothetical protein
MCKQCLHLETVDFSGCPNIRDTVFRFLVGLPNLRAAALRGCDLSDRPLLEVVASDANFRALRRLDVSQVNRITFTACHQLQSKKPTLELLHTAKPLFLSVEKLPASVHVSEEGRVCLWREANSAYMVRANALIPTELPLFYFEVQVLDEGHESSIGIGIAPRGHSLGGMPGWYSSSFGYHFDDGQIFHGDESGSGREWGSVCFCRCSPSSSSFRFSSSCFSPLLLRLFSFFFFFFLPSCSSFLVLIPVAAPNAIEVTAWAVDWTSRNSSSSSRATAK